MPTSQRSEGWRTLAALAVLFLALPSDATAAGLCREVNCGKPATAAACSQADKDKIQGLIGRLHGLADAAKQIRKGFNDTQCELDAVRDEIWGRNGAISKFSRTLPGLVPEGGALGDAWSWATIGMSISEEPDSAGPWVDAGKEVAGKVIENDTVKKEIIRRYVLDAAESARESGRYKQAASKYFREATKGMEALEKGMKGLNFALAWWELGTTADELDEKIASWLATDKDAAAMQAQLDKIDAQIEQVGDQIARLRAKCPDEGGGGEAGSPGSNPPSEDDAKSCGGGSATKSSISPEHGAWAQAVRMDATFFQPGFALAKAQHRSASKDRDLSRRVLSAHGELRVLRPLLARSAKRLQERVYPALAPFAYDLTKDVPPQLLAEIIRKASPDLRVLHSDMEQVLKRSQNVLSLLNGRTKTATGEQAGYFAR